MAEPAERTRASAKACVPIFMRNHSNDRCYDRNTRRCNTMTCVVSDPRRRRLDEVDFAARTRWIHASRSSRRDFTRQRQSGPKLWGFSLKLESGSQELDRQTRPAHLDVDFRSRPSRGSRSFNPHPAGSRSRPGGWPSCSPWTATGRTPRRTCDCGPRPCSQDTAPPPEPAGR